MNEKSITTRYKRYCNRFLLLNRFWRICKTCTKCIQLRLVPFRGCSLQVCNSSPAQVHTYCTLPAPCGVPHIPFGDHVFLVYSRRLLYERKGCTIFPASNCDSRSCTPRLTSRAATSFSDKEHHNHRQKASNLSWWAGWRCDAYAADIIFIPILFIAITTPVVQKCRTLFLNAGKSSTSCSN